MADPTIQTFCCRHNNNTDMAVVIMEEFNSDIYNAVCMVSSTMGILGAIYQILPRIESSSQHRWQSFSASRGRHIVIWLAFADLLASLGVFVRSILWLNIKRIMPSESDTTTSVVFCAISSAWTQYFYMATWLWTLWYAVDMKLILGEKAGRPLLYHAVAWICPAVLTIFGLTILYVPDANCHESVTLSTTVLRILPNYCATYILLAIVMIANPLLYVSSTKDLKNMVAYSLGQVTGRERKLMQTIQVKFALTNLAYYICWTPNLLNGILLWTLWFQLPVKVIITLWYIMAVTNPLQAFFNALVYQRWGRKERFRCWWRRHDEENSDASKHTNYEELNEVSPLITSQYQCCTPHTSINGSSSL